MQVSVESTGKLERRMRVELPAARIDQEVDSRLKSVGKTAKIKGFRPGKEPAHLKKKRAEAQLGSDASWAQKRTVEAVAGRSRHPRRA